MARPDDAPDATTPWVRRFRAVRTEAGVFLDLDGTLAEIVARPELTVLAPGVADVLRRLVSITALVAVVSGRPAAEVERIVGVPRVVPFGLYGLDDQAVEPRARTVVPAVRAITERVAGAWVEDKGLTVAIHVRGTEDPAAAERTLAPLLDDLASRSGLRLLRGKMVLELAPPDTPGKGAVVLRESRARRLRACLYAGDDLPDTEAFGALDALRDEGVTTVKVAVRSEETPDALLAAADVVVERPDGLRALLDVLSAP